MDHPAIAQVVTFAVPHDTLPHIWLVGKLGLT